VNTLTLLSFVALIGLMGSLVVNVSQTSSTANSILQDIQGSHVVDNVGLIMQDFWKSQYPNIQKAVSLGAELINSANNQNITLVVNAILSDANRLSSFMSNVLNTAANQWVAQYPTGNP
jgi:hypothetical protein